MGRKKKPNRQHDHTFENANLHLSFQNTPTRIRCQIRLDAAVALSTMHRRRPDIDMPIEKVEPKYLEEIAFYSRMREASLSAVPDTPAARLLLRTLKQRGQASLETLFRMMSLRYPVDAMQGAFQLVR